jgi:hypothetical protein
VAGEQVDKIRGLEDEAKEIRESRGHKKIVLEDQKTTEDIRTKALEDRTTFGGVLNKTKP